MPKTAAGKQVASATEKMRKLADRTEARVKAKRGGGDASAKRKYEKYKVAKQADDKMTKRASKVSAQKGASFSEADEARFKRNRARQKAGTKTKNLSSSTTTPTDRPGSKGKAEGTGRGTNLKASGAQEKRTKGRMKTKERTDKKKVAKVRELRGDPKKIGRKMVKGIAKRLVPMGAVITAADAMKYANKEGKKERKLPGATKSKGQMGRSKK